MAAPGESGHSIDLNGAAAKGANRPRTDMTTLFNRSRLAFADDGAAPEKREISTAQLAAEGAPQTEDINRCFQVTRVGTQASHRAEIREVHF